MKNIKNKVTFYMKSRRKLTKNNIKKSNRNQNIQFNTN